MSEANMPILDFFYNWNNKLNCRAFTTIRLHQSERFFPGAVFDVRLKGVSQGTATVQQVRAFRLSEINDYLAYLDTGYNTEECKKIIQTMYKNHSIDWQYQKIDFILLVFNAAKTDDKQGKLL